MRLFGCSTTVPSKKTAASIARSRNNIIKEYYFFIRLPV